MSRHEIDVKCVTTARRRFIADLRVLEVSCNDDTKYVLFDFNDNEAHMFDSLSELLEFVKREKTDVESYVAECP